MIRVLLLLAFLLTGCAPLAAASSSATPSPRPAGMDSPQLADYGPAPELSNTVWLNSDQPLRLANLRGKVVLLEMWTFDCINCQHVIPAMKDWYARYNTKGLVIIGNHYPEFSYEADLNNLKKAVADQGILYPVAQDNDGATWRAYNNSYWPTLYLIDRTGRIRYIHIGEGDYTQTTAAIEALLNSG